MYRIIWVVKASKLCDLRCRYCYEWEELGDPARISLAQWRKLLEVVQAYHERTARLLGSPVESRIVWHGGEPLLLPAAYVRSVLALEREVFGGAAVARGELVNAIQTNLHALSDEKIEVLREGGFGVGVSIDVVGGVRLALSGAATELRVAENMDRLREAGIPFGAITVLARHTLRRLRKVYDFFEELGVSFRVLPLFASPLNVADAPFAATSEEMVEALNDLFVYWLDRGCRIPVEPFGDYLRRALLKIGNLEQESWSRRTHGDNVFLVNTDGSLYQVIDAYEPGKALGNAFTQSVDEIHASERYRESLERDDALLAARCVSCPFHGPCNTAPLYESPLADDPSRRCGIAYEVQTFIERHVRESGLTEHDLAAILPGAAAGSLGISF